MEYGFDEYGNIKLFKLVPKEDQVGGVPYKHLFEVRDTKHYAFLESKCYAGKSAKEEPTKFGELVQRALDNAPENTTLVGIIQHKGAPGFNSVIETIDANFYGPGVEDEDLEDTKEIYGE